MKIRFGLLTLLGAAICSLPVHAQNQDDRRTYVSPSITYSMADDARLTDDGLGVQIAVGKKLTRGLNLELAGFFTSYDPEDGGPLSAEFKGVGVNALIFPFNDWKNLYGILGVFKGQTNDAPCTTRAGFTGCVNNYDSTVFDSGLGYRYYLGGMLNGASIRAEARYRMDSHSNPFVGATNESEFYDGVFSLGFILPLGHEAPEPEAPAEDLDVVSVDTTDSDNDGVPDSKDNCPGTPAGAVVDEFGCELDSDGDGVVDRLDRCPGTAPGVEVNEEGCPAVSCRPPFPGESVDENGCASGDTIVLRGVNFDFDSARLTANARTLLDGVADTLVSAPNMRVEIGGHTDNYGSDAYNLKLSEKRAAAVMSYLTTRGIEGSRMTARGYGEAQPIANNDTDENRELNRRVELKVQAEDGEGSDSMEKSMEEAADEAEESMEEAADDAEESMEEAADDAEEAMEDEVEDAPTEEEIEEDSYDE